MLTPTSPENSPQDVDPSATPAAASAPPDATMEPVVPSGVVADMLDRKDTSQLEVHHWVTVFPFSFKYRI